MAEQQQPEWNNSQIIAINKEPARCPSVPYASKEEALRGMASSFEYSLDGNWKFNYADNPADRPVGFQEVGYDVSEWAEIPVPANWELHGHGNPIYAPFHMPSSLKSTNM
ncbi:MAG: hypothetical protein GWN61_02265, partial [candidate division Zixibacteria bacterium]|nr:hypothetical protein [candidate division Zixibacteria bacterium]NIS44878.1 hypothetical protein [candidate division Zixibacteria bacterium]NIU12980.1 hypothetical protein [candidate division Zixibacteria bacterium]NIV05036.1 hypothetical protein [candidate division Zixibacteria bacterium]